MIHTKSFAKLLLKINGSLLSNIPKKLFEIQLNFTTIQEMQALFVRKIMISGTAKISPIMAILQIWKAR